jgi:proton-translocating NADH-quinone oxidoreductase chain M
VLIGIMFIRYVPVLFPVVMLYLGKEGLLAFIFKVLIKNIINNFGILYTHIPHFVGLGGDEGIYPWSLYFQLDEISICFVFLNSLICYLCIRYNVLNFRIKNFYFNTLLIVLMECFMYIVFLTQDFVVFYIFFEAILIPMFFMIGLLGSRNRKIHASYLFFVYTFVGSLLLLGALLFLIIKFNTTNVSEIYMMIVHGVVEFSFEEQVILWFLLFVGFSVKIPMFPVHIWLPEAHVEAPTTGSVILAGLLLKLGGYGMYRFLVPLCYDVHLLFQDYVLLLCAIAIIYSAMAALRQVDIKKIIAYSSVVHMNFGLAGLFLANVDGIVGFITIMLSHGIVSAGLFFIAGCIYERLGTRNMLYLKGLSQLAPILCVFFFLLTLSNMSFPGTLSFVSEFLIIVIFFSKFKLLSTFIVFGLSGSVFYNIWLVTRVLFSTLDKVEVHKISDLSYREFRILFVLTFLSFIFGTLLCGPLVELIKLSVYFDVLYF